MLAVHRPQALVVHADEFFDLHGQSVLGRSPEEVVDTGAQLGVTIRAVPEGEAGAAFDRTGECLVLTVNRAGRVSGMQFADAGA